MSKPISQVIRTCGRCAKEYKTPERRQKYCGSECAQEARIETYRAEINALIAWDCSDKIQRLWKELK